MDQKYSKLKSLKKGNFHMHLTGALEPDDLRNIAKYSKISLSLYEPLEEHMEFNNPLIWGIAKELTSTKKGLLEAIKIILDREFQDNVVYLELTLNPFGMLRRGMSSEDIVCSIEEAITYGNTKGITCKVKLGVNRRDGPDSIDPVKDVFFKLSKQSRVCIDLNGNERKYPNLPFIKPFKNLSSVGIPVSVHAGEFDGLHDSVLEALQMNPLRITHAIAAADHPNILNKILKQNVMLEMCITSNVKTGAIKDFKDHPIKKFLKHKIFTAIGTDDPSLFKTTLSKEFNVLSSCCVDEDILVKLNNDALKAIGISSN